ncbi:MAG: SusC/RagA family TonB-linked outer membrane protein [Bacteroidales bacterium]
MNINKNQVQLKEVLDEIESQTDYLFISNRNINLKQKVSVQAENKPVREVLNNIFNMTDLSFTVEGVNIVLSQKTKATTASTPQQQTHTISGIVVDSKGEPIIGANVVQKGTTNGTITDMDGKYTLQAPEGCLLQITYIGYNPIDVKVGKEPVMHIALQEDTQALDEVVVVGYGTQKKVNLTGSVETVKKEALTSKPVSSVAQALSGEAAGVTVIQRSSKPGSYDESIRIRGVGTWGNSNPLILVDGVEMGMDKVNPNDIESLSVLKDAAAASIYGSRAGNGVILITTKKGSRSEKPTVTFSTNFGVQVVTRFVEKDDALAYAKKRDKELTNDGKSPKFIDMIAQMEAGKWDPDHLVANPDWLDEVLRPAFQQNHNVSLTGGNKKISYLASLGYLNQQTVVGNNTDFERYNARLNTHSQITDWFGFDANMAYMNSIVNEPTCGTTEITMRALGIESYLPVQFSDGTYVHSTTNQNPVRMGFTDDYGKSKTTVNNFNGLISPEFKKWGFTLRGLLAYERQNFRKGSFQKTVEFNSFTPEGANTPIQNDAVTVSENKKTDEWSALTNITTNATLEYENTFGDHSVKALLGVSRELSNYENTKSSMSGFPNNDLDAIGAGTTKPVISGDYTRQALSSYFGRINYSFNPHCSFILLNFLI